MFQPKSNIKRRLNGPNAGQKYLSNDVRNKLNKKRLEKRLGKPLSNGRVPQAVRNINKMKQNPVNKMDQNNIVKSNQNRVNNQLTDPKKSVGPAVNDVRNKLIAKKRQGLNDARDVLAQIARKEDARIKLDKLKHNIHPAQINNQRVKMQMTGTRGNFQSTTLVQNAKQISGKPVLKKTIALQRAAPKKNWQNVGPYGVTRMQGSTLTRIISGSGKAASTPSRIQPLMKVVTNAPMFKKATPAKSADRYHPLKNNPNVVTIKNENAVRRSSAGNRSSVSQQNIKRVVPNRNNQPQFSHREQVHNQRPPVFNRYGGPPVWAAQQPVNMPMPIREEIRPTQLRITTANNYMDYYPTPRYEDTLDSRYVPSMMPPARAPAPKRPYYDTYEEYTPLPPKKHMALSTSITSRLDVPQRMSSNSGTKVIVTNLQHSVTLEDVEELFGNIGPLLSTRRIRDGVAEVIFLNENDAYRSLQVYHNRQLDGQPMNVTVVSRKMDTSSNQLSHSDRYYSAPTPRRPLPLSSVQFGASNLRAGVKSVLRAAGGSTSHAHELNSSFGGRQHIDVAPDVSAIHQALFSGRSNEALSGQQFYVKLPKPAFRGSK